MNTPPDEYVLAPPEEVRTFVAEAARSVAIPEDHADRLAEMLTENDLRGVFSHGSRLIATYARRISEGRVNPAPRVGVIDETPVSVLVDGDGGLGYFPADRGIELAIDKAATQGIAAMATRNHGHFGAAGLYTRQALERDLLVVVTSGQQRTLSPGDPIYSAADGPPMAFGAPAAEEHDLILDFGPMADLYPNSPHREEIAELAPGLVLRSIGLASICHAWGGLLAGLGINGRRDYQEYDGADQGSFAICFQIDLFTEPDRFKRAVDEYVRRVRELEPLDAFDPDLPGGPEAERYREYSRDGIPIGPDHQNELEGVAEKFGLDVPWS